MGQSLFLNGVYEGVLEEILVAQTRNSRIYNYLQPYKSQAIKILKNNDFIENPKITLYISTTTNLTMVTYVADIVGWENKETIHKGSNQKLLKKLNKHIKEYQPSEGSIYLYSDNAKEKKCINLISIKNLKKLSIPFSTSNLIKVSNNTPYKPRTQAGGWSVVFNLPDLINIKKSGFEDVIEQAFSKQIQESLADNAGSRRLRIKKENKKPEPIQIISKGFKRNPDVVAEVLIRANGVCEKCNTEAPFIRKKNNTPYLEVHHIVTLADGGDDSIKNSLALCPNCHREVHFGIKNF